MKEKAAYRALRKVASNHGVSVEEVVREIEYAIETATGSSDPEIQKMWAQIPCAGTRPNALELVEYLAMML